MKTSRGVLVSMVCASLLSPVIARSAPLAILGPGETIIPRFSQPIPNVPGKTLTAIEVDYAPGGRSLPHRHAGSAFITGYVLSGHIRSQVEGQPLRVYDAGQSFFEAPGSHHLVGENASKTEPAKLLAVFVVDSDDKALTVTDKQEH